MRFFKRKPKLNYITTTVDKTLTDIILEYSIKAKHIENIMAITTKTQALYKLQHKLVELDQRIKILRQIQEELREQELRE